MSAFLRPNKRPRRKRASAVSATRVMPTNANATHNVNLITASGNIYSFYCVASEGTPDLKVFISGRDSTCDECGQALGHSAWICLLGERGALCLSCADLDHLVFLPAGDVALTRRARKHLRCPRSF